MDKSNGREVVLQLITAYEEETRLYDELGQTAAEQHLLLCNGGGHAKLARLIERQRVIAEQIGRIEAGIAPLRDYWEKIRDSARAAHVRSLGRTLDALLEDLADRIHAIVEIERENSRSLLGTLSRG